MQILLIILQIMPYLIEIIKTIDAAIPDRGKGPEKKAEVVGMVNAALFADPSVPNELIPEIMTVVSARTDSLVSTFKETGVFEGKKE